MDYSSREGFLSQLKCIFSSLCKIIMFWASRLSSPMPIPKQYHCRLQPSGLKIYSQGRQLQNTIHPSLIINSQMISSPSPPSSPFSSTSALFRSLTNSSSWYSANDDFLGTESGVYMNSDYEQELIGVLSDKSEAAYNRYLAKRSQRHSTMIKEYPPPLPHMPRVLTRHYENGNLVLKDEGMQQYFETTRRNGRLLLNLVQLEDNRMAQSDRVAENDNEELELEGIEPIEEEQDDSVEYQETEADDDDDDAVEDEETHCEGSIMILASLQKIRERCLEDEDDEICRALRKCFTSAGRRSTECERILVSYWQARPL